MIKITQYFIDSYLSPGITRDNFIFEDCSQEFLKEAKIHLSNQSESIKSCVIEIDSNITKILEQTLSNFENITHKKFVARDYICSEILRNLLVITNTNPESLQQIESGLNAIKKGDISKVKQYHTVAPMPYDITCFSKEIQKFELNFLLNGTTNRYIQEAINNFISSREPFSVKVFSTQGLPTYLDQSGNIIQSPHDYMARNVKDFIESDLEKQ